jgi:hypothetical protein
MFLTSLSNMLGLFAVVLIVAFQVRAALLHQYDATLTLLFSSVRRSQRQARGRGRCCPRGLGASWLETSSALQGYSEDREG